jgi:prepilin-type N-terminal cleavage/methylation domain-containing protein
VRLRQRQPGGARRRGFSLIELLIAISVLGIGLAMAGMLIPTAMKRTQSSVDDVLGSIMAENALATAKAKLHFDASSGQVTSSDPSATAVTLSTGGFTDLGAGAKPLLTESDLAYPQPRLPIASYNTPAPGPNGQRDWWKDPSGNVDRPTAPRGCIVLARQVTSGQNDFQFVVISFNKQFAAPFDPALAESALPNTTAGHVAVAKKISVDIVSDASQLTSTVKYTPAPELLLRDGTPIILDADADVPTDPSHGNNPAGTFAKVVRVGTNSSSQPVGQLDHYLGLGVSSPASVNVWIVYEAAPPNTPPDPKGTGSPAMSVFVTRTTLNR